MKGGALRELGMKCGHKTRPLFDHHRLFFVSEKGRGGRKDFGNLRGTNKDGLNGLGEPSCNGLSWFDGRNKTLGLAPVGIALHGHVNSTQRNLLWSIDPLR